MTWTPTNLTLLNTSQYTTWIQNFNQLTQGLFGLFLLLMTGLIAFTSLKTSKATNQQSLGASTFITALAAFTLWVSNIISLTLLTATWSAFAITIAYTYLKTPERGG